MSSGNDALILKLGYDPANLEAGLAQAKADVAKYKVDAVTIETDLKNAKLQLLTEFSSANRAALQQRISDLRSELAQETAALDGKSAAEKAQIIARIADLKTQLAAEQQVATSYSAQVQKVNELKAAFISASQQAKQSSLAAGLFSQAGGQPTLLGIAQNQLQAIEALSPGLSGIVANISRLSQLIVGGGFASGAPEATLASDVGEVSTAGVGLTSVIGGITVALAALGTGAVVTGKHLIDEAQAINNAAAATGLSVREVQVYNQLAKDMGLSTDEVTQAFARTAAQLGKFLISGEDADGSTQQLIKVLNAFGIQITDTQGKLRPINDILTQFADATDKISDPTERVAIRLDALGPRAKVLAQAMNQATQEGKSFGEMLRDIESSGPIFSDQDIQILEQAKIAIDDITHSVEGLLVKLASPLIESLGGLLSDRVRAAQDQAFKDTQAKLPSEQVTSPAFIAEERRRTAEILLQQEQQSGTGIPKIEPESVTKARADLAKAEADAKMRQLSAEQQIVAARQQLAALESGAPEAQGENLAKNLEQQAGLVKQIADLEHSRATQAAQDNQKIAEGQAKVQKAYSDVAATLGILHAQFETSSQAQQLGPLPEPSRSSQTAIEGVEQTLASLEERRIALSSDAVKNEKELSDIYDQEAEAIKKLGELRTKQFEDQIKAAQQEKNLLDQIDASIRQAGAQAPDLIGSLRTPQPGKPGGLDLGDLGQAFQDITATVQGFGSQFKKNFDEATTDIRTTFSSLHGLASDSTRNGGDISNVNFLDEVRSAFRDLVQPQNSSESPADKLESHINGVLDLAQVGKSIVGNITSIFSGPGGAKGLESGGISGLVAGAELGSIIPGIGTAVGAVVGGIAGAIGGLFGGSQKNQARAQDKANQILDAANKVVQNLNLGTVDLKTAITLLQDQLSQANTISGKGTASIKQQTQQNLENEINQLQAQQKQILDQFQQQLALLQVPDGARSAAQAIQQIANALKQAADAGASATDQINFFNASVAELSHQLGDTLTQDEQNVLGMLRQDIDLREQQQQIVTNANQQEAQIRQSLGLQRTLTPAQQAAQQIALIEQQKNAQLASLKEQQNMLEAQLDGQAELFGFSVKDLDNQNEKAVIIAAQLALQKQQTAEIATQIAQQQAFYQSLLSGTIPSLPSNLLPPGFSLPGGATYNFGQGAIAITAPPGMTAAQLADAFSGAIDILNQRAAQGGQ